MHFTATFIATSAAVSGALASYYEEPVYYTSAEAVYTSIKTCTESSAGYAAPTSEAVYGAPSSAPVYAPAPTSYEAPTEVTYTSYALVTVTSCADYVVSCPAATYTSTAYSVSSCTGSYGAPSSVPYYVPPVNTTAPVCYGYDCPAETPVYTPTETPVYYPTETPSVYPTETPTYYTNTYYTTVCPGKDYCYATTVTSTYCPGPSSTVVTYVPQSPTYTPVPPPVYTTVPSCPGGYGCPTTPVNQTTPTYTPPPFQTGAASANAVSFGVAVIAGLAALFIAA
jgi:hypothetical protein